MKNLYSLVSIFLLTFFGYAGYAQTTEVVPFYIIIGQSNTGWTPATGMTPQQAALYRGLIPRTEIWNPGRGNYSAVIEPLEVGVNTLCENFADLTQFGPEASLFVSLQNQNPRKRFVFKQGQGGTTLAVDWRPPTGTEYIWQSGGRWQQFASWITTAVSQAAAKGYKLDLRAVIWMQGEDDAKTLVNASAYLVNLGTFFGAINNMWEGFVNTYGFPNSAYKKVIGRIYAPTSYPFRDIVRGAQEAFCAVPSNNAILINTDNYPLQDWVHYNPTGQIQFGLDIFNAIPENNSTLPVTLSSLKAHVQANNILIEWKAANESGIKSYEVEKSEDGKDFNTLALRTPSGNGLSANYTVVDVSPWSGNTYYRLRMLHPNGDVSYTQIVKVTVANQKNGYQVYPNPISGNSINLQMINQPKGIYCAQLINTSGHIIISKQINYTGGTNNIELTLNNNFQRGNYMLQITGIDKKVQSLKIIF